MKKRRSRSLFLMVLLAGIAAIIGVWYATSPRKVANKPAYGGDYVEGIAGSPSRINPLFASANSADQTLVSLVFAGLTRLDNRGSAFPDLASTWNVSQDGKTYTFALRPGLLWQDGQPLTAADVVFTYQLLQAKSLPFAPPLAQFLQNATIEASSDLTLTIKLAQPFAPLPSYLTLGILPQHILAGLDAGQLYDSFFNQQPIGAGPYRLERLTPSEADLVANVAYYQQPPFIQHMQLRFYPDEGELFAALDAHQVSAALFNGALGSQQLLAIDQRRDLRLTPLPSGQVTFVYFNLDLPVFQDRRLRQALLYAIDRDALVTQTLQGQATLAQSPLAPGGWAYSASLTRYGFDQRQAGLLLDDAGWRLDSDGVRRKDGRALAFQLTTTSDATFVAVAQAIASSWNALGAQVEVQQEGVTSIVRDRLASHSYAALLLSQPARADPDPWDAWHTAPSGQRGANYSGLNDKRFDALLDEAQAAPLTRRKELYESFQELFAQEVPSIPLYESTLAYVQDASVQDVKLGLTLRPGDRFWQVQEWFLKTQ